MAVECTDRPISGGQKAAELPGKVRIHEKLEELLGKLDFSNVFEAAAGTIVGLHPPGRSSNYFRIDLQQDPQPGKPLNIQYQVSTSTVACVQVDPKVKDFGVSGVQEGLRKSLGSGSYPVKGEDNGGTPLYIYSVKVVEKKKEQKMEEKASSSSKGPTKEEKRAQKEAEEKERQRRLLASLGQKQAGKDGKRK